MSNYSTNLTEKQWQVIKNIVEPQERSRKYFLRDILNAIFYVNYYEFLTKTAKMMVTNEIKKAMVTNPIIESGNHCFIST